MLVGWLVGRKGGKRGWRRGLVRYLKEESIMKLNFDLENVYPILGQSNVKKIVDR